MPKIETTEKNFFKLLGRSYTDDELEAIFPVAKAELDGHSDGVIKIELNDTNRPDLWSAAGVARQINCYEGKMTPLYDFFSTKEESVDNEGVLCITSTQQRVESIRLVLLQQVMPLVKMIY
jgi:phenylalanyl-tRNA synthetase beta chain